MEWLIIILLIFGLVITISVMTTNKKEDGSIIITEEDGKKLISLEIDMDPDDIEKMKFVVFKVVKNEIAN